MREIKFRAWDKNSSMMIEEVSIGMCSIGFPDEEELNEALKAKGFDPEIYELPENWDDTGEDWYRILNNYDLMQYTGLKDKNGVGIYEGDIVTWLVNERETSAPVYYDERQASFWMGKKIGCKDSDFGLVLNDWMRGEYEIIGNIYENPELIKEQ